MQKAGIKIAGFILYTGILFYSLTACNKTAYNPQSFPVHNIPPVDTLHNLRHMIDSLPSADLFLLALQRTGYDSLLSQTGGFYTVAVPTDSLLIAAGYTKNVISYLDPSLLVTGIIVSQIWNGQITDSILNDADGYVPINSIPDPANQGNPNSYSVAKQGGPSGGLWINGSRISYQPSGVHASNGYIFVANAFYTAPVSNAWVSLQTRPEFSFFVAACRINDSVVESVGETYRSNTFCIGADTSIFQNQMWGCSGSPGVSTYFVPTNQAFINAGFNSIDDIRTYALTYTFDPTGTTLSPLDSIIYGHWMPYNDLYYFDLLKNPNLNMRQAADLRPSAETELYSLSYFVNTDPYNEGLPTVGQNYPYKGILNFQVSDTTVTITCNSSKNPPAAIVVEHDILCTPNWILHGVDHLFWPY